MEWSSGEFVISTDRSRIDVEAVHRFLCNESYWAAGIPFETVRRSIDHALCFGLYHGERQAGFARVVTDFATFAYIGDVFILKEYRGRGLSKWLMGIVRNHPDLHGLRRWMLATRDAHGLYQQIGFTPLHSPERWMEIRDYDVYKR
jgi:GNAT superfamily N-acetyltransferase